VVVRARLASRRRLRHRLRLPAGVSPLQATRPKALIILRIRGEIRPKDRKWGQTRPEDRKEKTKHRLLMYIPFAIAYSQMQYELINNKFNRFLPALNIFYDITSVSIFFYYFFIIISLFNRLFIYLVFFYNILLVLFF
jgi:hypothetical protein